jgi:undecaprenyl-diphosphatase
MQPIFDWDVSLFHLLNSGVQSGFLDWLMPTITNFSYFRYQFLKPLFARPRPCHVLEHVRLLVGCGGAYGFPSNHACNFFGTATFFFYFYRKTGWVMFAPAILIGWSRVYVGVHYPSDAVGGALWGILLALFIIFVARLVFKDKFVSVAKSKNKP